MKNAIELKNLSKQYQDFSLDGVSFSLPSGSILGLVGENGAGKSTTIKLILNAINQDGGSATVLGCDSQDKAFQDIKNDIGAVLDEACFPQVLNPKNVNVIMKNAYRNWDERLFFSYLKKFSLPEKKKFKEFSRGMKMKLSIAVALSHHPKLLVLDEATSGLDPMVRDEILDIFNDFTRSEEHSILLSSHIVSDLEKICDYIAFLHEGKLVFYEEKDQLLEKYSILKLTHDQFSALPKQAIKGKKDTAYGVDALVLRDRVSQTFPAEHTTVESIILFLSKGVKSL